MLDIYLHLVAVFICLDGPKDADEEADDDGKTRYVYPNPLASRCL
jgi:hypothetical protein